MNDIWPNEVEILQWKIVGYAVGALVGAILILSVRMPFYLSLPAVVGLTLAGGKLSEALSASRNRG